MVLTIPFLRFRFEASALRPPDDSMIDEVSGSTLAGKTGNDEIAVPFAGPDRQLVHL